MSIFNKIIDFFKNLFKKDKTKMIEAPQQNVEINQNNIQHNETINNINAIITLVTLFFIINHNSLLKSIFYICTMIAKQIP